jgi:hypothetical protein
MLARAAQWARRQRGDGSFMDRAAKRPRTKSYEFCLLLDSSMASCCRGVGLARIQTVGLDGQEKDPYDWKSHSVAPDQGPSEKCGMNFLKFGQPCFPHVDTPPGVTPGLCIDDTDDLSHGGWNDFELNLKAMTRWSQQLLTISAYNVNHGSRYAPSRLNQLRLTLRDYMKVASCQLDGIFQYYLPKMLEAEGTPERITEPNIAETMWESLPEALATMGMKVGRSRFYGAVKRAKAEWRLWPKKACVLTMASVQMGYESKQKFQKALDSLKSGSFGLALHTRDDSGGKLTMKEADKDLNLLRASVENRLQLASTVYSMDDFMFFQRSLVVTARAWDKWHGIQNKVLRSTTATIPWEIEQLSGSIWEAFIQTLLPVSDNTDLLSLGILTTWRMPELMTQEMADDKHCLTDEQDERCLVLARSCFGFNYRRFLRLLPFLRGWPRGFVMLLSKPYRTAFCQRLRGDYDNFKWMLVVNEPWMKPLIKRSTFQLKSVMQIVLILEREGWSVSDRLESLLQKKLQRIICSQLTEDGFQRVKQAIHNGRSDVAREERIWATLVDKKVMSSVHHFGEADRTREPPARGAVCDPSWFHSQPLKQQQTLDFRAIMKGGQSTSWNSPGPGNVMAPCADMVFAQHVRTNNLNNDADAAWLSTLIPDTMLLRSHLKGIGSAEWNFVLGDVCGQMLAVWPAVKVTCADGGHYYLPAIAKKGHPCIEMLPVLALNDFSGSLLNVSSPYRVALGLALQGKPCDPTVVRNMRFSLQDNPESLKCLLARNA